MAGRGSELRRALLLGNDLVVVPDHPSAGPEEAERQQDHQTGGDELQPDPGQLETATTGGFGVGRVVGFVGIVGMVVDDLVGSDVVGGHVRFGGLGVGAVVGDSVIHGRNVEFGGFDDYGRHSDTSAA